MTDVPEAATEAYLARIPAAAKARSDAYFEGGYWLILWDFLYGAAVLPLLLGLRWSARMRDLSERVSRFKPVRTLVYWAFFVVATAVLTYPLTLYAELVSDPNSSYVLHHVYKTIGVFAALIVGAFAVLQRALRRCLAQWGDRWQVHGIGDTAVLPLVVLLISTIFFVLTPVTNRLWLSCSTS